jgi:hypothetical protein
MTEREFFTSSSSPTDDPYFQSNYDTLFNSDKESGPSRLTPEIRRIAMPGNTIFVRIFFISISRLLLLTSYIVVIYSQCAKLNVPSTSLQDRDIHRTPTASHQPLRPISPPRPHPTTTTTTNSQTSGRGSENTDSRDQSPAPPTAASIRASVLRHGRALLNQPGTGSARFEYSQTPTT